MEAFTWLQVWSPCFIHGYIEQMASWVHSSINSSFSLINMAFNLAANIKSLPFLFKLAKMKYCFLLYCESFQVEFDTALFKVTFIAWLAATLRMANCFRQNYSHLAIFTIRSWLDAKYFITSRWELNFGLVTKERYLHDRFLQSILLSFVDILSILFCLQSPIMSFLQVLL